MTTKPAVQRASDEYTQDVMENKQKVPEQA